MTSMLEFRNNNNESIEHLLSLYKAPSPNLQLFVATNTVITYATKQGLGYVVWRGDLSKWMTYSKRHPSAWLKENPNNVPAPEKVSSKRGKRVTVAASSSKRKKSVAQAEKSASKGIVIREPVIATSQSEKQAAPRDVSSKKTVRKTRAKRKRSVSLPSPTLLESPSTNTRSNKHATTTYSKARVSFSSFYPLHITLICFSFHELTRFFVCVRSNEGMKALFAIPSRFRYVFKHLLSCMVM